MYRIPADGSSESVEGRGCCVKNQLAVGNDFADALTIGSDLGQRAGLLRFRSHSRSAPFAGNDAVQDKRDLPSTSTELEQVAWQTLGRQQLAVTFQNKRRRRHVAAEDTSSHPGRRLYWRPGRLSLVTAICLCQASTKRVAYAQTYHAIINAQFKRKRVNEQRDLARKVFRGTVNLFAIRWTALLLARDTCFRSDAASTRFDSSYMARGKWLSGCLPKPASISAMIGNTEFRVVDLGLDCSFLLWTLSPAFAGRVQIHEQQIQFTGVSLTQEGCTALRSGRKQQSFRHGLVQAAGQNRSAGLQHPAGQVRLTLGWWSSVFLMKSASADD